MSPAPGPGHAWALVVEGRDRSGASLVRTPLPHGVHPVSALWQQGFRGVVPLAADADPRAGHVVIAYLAEPARPADLSPAVRRVSRDTDLRIAPGEQPVRVQRLAAYALVRSRLGVLLTELSERTNAAGRWTLPGGGVDPGEPPLAALVREVREETGQQVVPGRLVEVVDGHWIGRSPGRRVEDFHAVRLVYSADCPDPGPAVVLDIGGTTSAASWVPAGDVVQLPVVDTWRLVLEQWLGRLAPGEPGDTGTR